jgi:hypothetical protein
VREHNAHAKWRVPTFGAVFAVVVWLSIGGLIGAIASASWIFGMSRIGGQHLDRALWKLSNGATTSVLDGTKPSRTVRTSTGEWWKRYSEICGRRELFVWGTGSGVVAALYVDEDGNGRWLVRTPDCEQVVLSLP